MTIGKHATNVYYSEEGVKVIYHSTAVVEVFNDRVKLNTGGWFSNTTKKRMNQASDAFNLGYSVFQKKGVWYANYNGQNHQFEGNSLLLFRKAA
jgi:hypothetical protein